MQQVEYKKSQVVISLKLIIFTSSKSYSIASNKNARCENYLSHCLTWPIS